MARFEETKDYTLIKFCKAFDVFIIPKFQRPYDWKNKQLQEFLDSILETNDENYFIGNIVSVKDDEHALSIVDGQQRLTTIFLILISLRHILSNLDVNADGKTKVSVLERKIDSLLDYKDNETGEFDSKLSLQRKTCQDIFNKIKEGVSIIEKDIKSDTERKYIKNYEIIKRKIESEIKGSELEHINSIFEKVQKLQFVSIQCQSDNDINEIFEGFNSTGLGLSVADLVKNAVLQASSNDELIQKKTEETWSFIESMFDSKTMSRFPKFLRYQWMSRHGYVTMPNLYRVIKEEKIRKEYEKDIVGYVNELSNDAEIYMGHIYKDFENNLQLPDDLLNAVKKFRFLQSEQVYSVLLAYYRAFSSKKIKQSLYLAILEKFWIFAFRTRFVSISPSDYERLFANHCKGVMDSEDSNEISKHADILFDKLSKQVSNESQFIDNLKSDLSCKTDSQLIKTLLLRIMSEEKPEVTVKKPENEHILPQEPKKWGFQKSEIKDFVHKLGNITILHEGDNKLAADDSFENKQEVYKKSIFNLNKQVAGKWSRYFSQNELSEIRVGIEKRGHALAVEIERIFKF